MSNRTETQVAQIQEAAVDRLLLRGHQPKTVVAYLVKTFPTVPAGTVMFELVCIAHDLQARYSGRNDDTWRLGCELYQVIALFAADIHGVQELIGHAPLCDDVLTFWGAAEGFFRYDGP